MTTPLSPLQPAATPKNGTPAAPAQQPAAPAAPPAADPRDLKLKEAEAREVKLKRELVIGKQQWEREKQSFGEKLKSADEYARLRKLAPVDIGTVAKAFWGDDWYQKLTAYQTSGGAPTAESVAAQLERVREDTLAEVENKRKAEREQQEQQTREAQAADLQTMRSDAAFAYEQLAEDYPLFAELGDKERIAQVAVAQLQPPQLERYRQALRVGDVDACAELMKGAFVRLENMLLGIADRAAGHAKYAERVRGKLTPPKTGGTAQPVKSSQSLPPSQSPQSLSQGRRSITNDLTGATPPEPPKHRSDADRLAAALAKYRELAKPTE